MGGVGGGRRGGTGVGGGDAGRILVRIRVCSIMIRESAASIYIRDRADPGTSLGRALDEPGTRW